MTFFLFDAIRGTFSSKQTHGAKYGQIMRSHVLYTWQWQTLYVWPPFKVDQTFKKFRLILLDKKAIQLLLKVFKIN